MKRFYIILIISVAIVSMVIVGVNAYLVTLNIKPSTTGNDQIIQATDTIRDKEMISRMKPCDELFPDQQPVQTGSLTVFILPYTKNMDACDVKNAIESIVGMKVIDGRNYGASVKGQYDLDGNIVTSPDKVRFVIDPSLKKPDGSSIDVKDIDEEFLFGNAITGGGVSFKDGSGIGTTIVVVDTYYEDMIKAKMDDIRSALLG